MASKEQCEAALHDLASRLEGVDDGTRSKHVLDRSITCRIPDLGTTYSGRLSGGKLCDIAEHELPGAQLRLTVRSDDLVAVTSGRLAFPKAWATGRLRIDASLRDLIRLRALL